MYRWVQVTALLLVSCASAPQEKPAVDWRTLPPLPQSSLDAVLNQADQFKFTRVQLDSFEALALSEHQSVALIREELAAKRKSEEPTGAAGMGPNEGMQRPPGMGGNGGMGRGGGSGLGGGAGRGGGKRGDQRRRDHSAELAALFDRLDDVDTGTFMQALEQMTPAQHELAVSIASKYRAELFDRRELMKRQGHSETDGD